MTHPPLRILLLEDNDSDAGLILRELRKMELTFDAVRAVSRADFVAALQAPPPDLILSDYSLPGFDGLSALDLARACCPNAPFIFVSGALGEERAIESLKRGATDYVLKDRLTRLAPSVHRALDEADERRLRQAAEAEVRRQAAALADANARLQVQVMETQRQAERARAWAKTAEYSRGQLQMLSRRLVELQEQERRALSRELHDETGQVLTALKLGLSIVEREADNPARARQHLASLQQTTDALADTLHRLAMNLRPTSLDRYGLMPALDGLLADFKRRTGLATSLEGALGDERLPNDVETALYRIVQEALTNVMRHAGAHEVRVALADVGERVCLTITDDGRGFDVEDARAGGRLGLLGMGERAEMLGGRLQITSRPGAGTTVAVRMPLHPLVAAAEPNPLAPLSDTDLAPAEPLPAAELARAKVLGEALIDIVIHMSTGANTDDILQIVLRDSAEAIGCETAHVMLREPGVWRVQHRHRLPDTFFAEAVPDAEAQIGLWVERTGQVFVANDPLADERLDAQQMEDRSVKSIAVMPLATRERFLGILTYANRTVATPFRPSEITFLTRLAALVSLALENRQLHEAAGEQAARLAERVTALDAMSCELRTANGRLQEQTQLLQEAAERLEQRVRRRTAELSLQAERLAILHEIDREILAARAPAEVAQAAVDGVQTALSAAWVAASLFDAPTQQAEVLAAAGMVVDPFPVGTRLPLSEVWLCDRVGRGETAAIRDVAELPTNDPWKARSLAHRIRSLTSFPLRAGQAVIGSLVVSGSEPGELRKDEIDLVQHVADSLAIAIEHARLNEQLQASQTHLRALARRLVARQEHERRYVADQLYNEVGQILAALKMQLSRDPPRTAPMSPTADTQTELDRVIRDLQAVAMQLRPLTLDRLGLASAVRQYATEWSRRSGIAAEVDVQGLAGTRPAPEVEMAVYRVIQEALSNVAQHAGADTVRIVLREAAERLIVEVADNGVGFDEAEAPLDSAIGLLAMRERVESVGGALKVARKAGGGTLLRLEAPAQGEGA